MELIEKVDKLRLKICEFRIQEMPLRNVSTHLNAAEIVLCLVEFGIRDKRPIQASEESWFTAELYLAYTFDDSEWEEIHWLYKDIVKETKKLNYFRK